MCQLELYHLKDVNWRLIIRVPMDKAVKTLNTLAQSSKISLDNVLNHPQDINCFPIDVRCDSLEVAKKIFKKLHAKSFKF